jgi:predicted O-linked N-acetylglucosamine transferase (SPINDLY family)
MPELSIPQAMQHAIARHCAGDVAEAEAIYRQVLAVQPDHSDALHLMAASLYQRGHPADGLPLVEKALALSPRQSFYHNTRGRILLALGRMAEGVVAVEEALRLEPQNAEAHFNLAEVRALEGRLSEAEAEYRRALLLKPVYAAAAEGVGLVLRRQGELGGALPYLQLAASLDENNGQFLLNLASVFHMLGHLDLAIPRYEGIAQRWPERAETYINLASCYALAGNKRKSVETYEKAREFAPENPVILDGLYEARRQACQWEGLESLETDCMRVMCASLARGEVTGFRGFTVLYLPTSGQEILENNQGIARQVAQGVSGRLWSERDKGRPRRLRIGYLTADVKEHPTAHLILNLFRQHDRERFECFLYSWAKEDHSHFRAEIKKSVEHFVECFRLPDKDIAELVAQDEIDILVDLMGHTADNRIGVLARRPAPVQVEYLGYPGTSGAEYMDYIVGDRWVTPADREADFSEKVIRLPHSYQINSHAQVSLGLMPSRSALGLPASGAVLCCMNNSYKLDPFVFGIWARLLRALPGSVLWLLQGPEEMAQYLRKWAQEQEGIDPDRLVFGPRLPRDMHLTRLQAADVFLDTRHYNAHTTATDALWAGVPVITVAGETFSSRVAAGLLYAMGMDDLILADWESYEARILALLQDPVMLRGIKDRIARARKASPLFDTAALVGALENAYGMIWQRWEDGLAPTSMDIPVPTQC